MSFATDAENRRVQIINIGDRLMKYDGTRKPKIINAYISAVTYRLLGDAADHRMLIAMLLVGNAHLWLNNLMETEAWSSMDGPRVLALLKETFYPINYGDAALRGLRTLNRGKRSLEWFLEEFTRLQRELPASAHNDDHFRITLMDGCGEPYAGDLRRQPLTSANAVFDYLQRQVNTTASEPASTVPTAGAGYQNWPHPDAMELDHVESAEVDITTLTVAEINAFNVSHRKGQMCYKCRQRGHIARSCPQSRKPATPAAAATEPKKEER